MTIVRTKKLILTDSVVHLFPIYINRRGKWLILHHSLSKLIEKVHLILNRYYIVSKKESTYYLTLNTGFTHYFEQYHRIR